MMTVLRNLPHPRALVMPALAVILGLILIVALLVSAPRRPRAQEEKLLDRISNERMVEFEQQLEDDVNTELRNYLSPGQFVLSVRVIWDRNIIPAITAPGLQPDKQKLPGFPIFVRSASEPLDDSTPQFTRLVVKILIDETLPEYYERFLRKIIPIVARFVPSRGDQLILLKETFPELNRDQLPPTIPEKELMEQLGLPLGPPPSALPEALPGAPSVVGVPVPIQGRAPPPSLIEEARVAYDEGRYNDSLRLVQAGFQRATTNRERSVYLGMEGSLFYTMDNRDAARASWRRALTYDPGNMEVHRVLNYLQGPKTPSEVESQ